MPNPATSLEMTVATFNALVLLEQVQNIDVGAQNTLVRSKGIADRYDVHQITKQKQTINWMGHFYNSNLSLEASNLSIHLWTLGGTAYLGQIKGGTLDITNSGPEASGIAVLNEYPLPTNTDLTITSDIMIVTQDAFSYLNMTAVEGGFAVTVAIQFAAGASAVGEAVTFTGIISSTSHKVVRDGIQMENLTVTLGPGSAPTVKYNGANETASLIYLAILGTAVSTFDVDTGVNEYVNDTDQTAMVSKLNIRFADKALIEMSVTMEVQGAMVVNEGS